MIVSYKPSILTGDYPPFAQVNKVKLIDYNTMKQSLGGKISQPRLRKKAIDRLIKNMAIFRVDSKVI